MLKIQNGWRSGLRTGLPLQTTGKLDLDKNMINQLREEAKMKLQLNLERVFCRTGRRWICRVKQRTTKNGLGPYKPAGTSHHLLPGFMS